MEIKLDPVKEDKYFDRKLVTFTLKKEQKETVKIADIKTKLSEHFKDGFVVVYTVKSRYGLNEMYGCAHVYKDIEAAKKVLQRYILEKNGVEYAKEKTKK
ncbi:hypothetical protein M1293_03715 [Candidatus Parvarchaeota archaeon]|nr:hypothetical protein [Candidatus Parvarchaeota archaeon]